LEEGRRVAGVTSPIPTGAHVASGPLSVTRLENEVLKTYKEFPHGMPTTEATTINSNLLALISKAMALPVHRELSMKISAARKSFNVSWMLG